MALKLPKLFGDADFTKRTLRLAWHITSVLALGFAALLVGLAFGGESPRTEGRIISAALSIAPARAISLLRCCRTGLIRRSAHSYRLIVSPMPEIRPSDK